MKNKILIFIALFTFSIASFANMSFKEATKHLVDTGNTGKKLAPESWIKYTCHGPLTPIGIYPIVHGDVVKFYYPVRSGEKYLSLREIQAQDHTRFEKFARICTVRKFAQTDLTGFTGDWLGWGTGYFDSKLSKGEVIITSNQCRELGSPCSRVEQCCGSNTRSNTGGNTKIATTTVTCNQDTNACEQGGRQE